MKKFLLAALAVLPAIAIAAPAHKAAKPVKELAASAFTPGMTARELAPLMPAPPAALAFAYPVGPAGLPRPDPTATFTATGADPSMKLTMKQIGDANNPPDWFPKEHA